MSLSAFTEPVELHFLNPTRGGILPENPNVRFKKPGALLKKVVYILNYRILYQKNFRKIIGATKMKF